MSSYAAPRRDGDFSNDPTHESPYDDSFYGNESEYFENSYNLDQHDPYHHDPTHFAHTDAPSETDHLASEFDDEFEDDPYNQRHNNLEDPRYTDPRDPYFDQRSAYTGDQYSQYGRESNNTGGDDESVPESQYTYDTTERRDFKYSTANVKRHGWCYKFCCIALMFLIFFLISTAISILIQKLLFGGDDEPFAPEIQERDPNATFPRDKSFINQVCSIGVIDIDGGARCREDCLPQFFECCDPFQDFKSFNFTTFLEATNTTLPPTEIIDEEVVELREKGCSFGSELRGCMAYAKCQGVTETIDPAPANLPHLCGDFGMELDPDSCEAACRNARCCFNDEGLSCLADNIDICMDYAPCQNLRSTDNMLQTAPETLDQDCFLQLPECFEACEKATCCNDPTSRCFQENFMSCMTYAPCNNVTDINIEVPEIFSVLPIPPAELIYACDEQQTVLEKENLEACAKYCEQAACCYDLNPQGNCFHDDPLGCLLWHQHCQIETPLMEAWWTGQA